MVGTDTYALFRGWCAATGRPLGGLSTSDVVAFLWFYPGAASTVRKRAADVLAGLAGDGHPAPAMPPAVRATVWRTPDLRMWDDAEGALLRCPVAGWRHGLTGRRDQTVVVLAGMLGWSRAQIRALGVDQVTFGTDMVRVAGEPVPSHTDPARCGACAVARWVETVAWLDDSPGKTREIITLARRDQIAATHRHTPQRVPPTWTVLLPPIDRYGWPGWAPLSLRSLSKIVHDRQRMDGPPAAPDGDADGPRVRASSMYADLTWDETDAVLDRICAEADVVLARVADALAAGTTGPIPTRP